MIDFRIVPLRRRISLKIHRMLWVILFTSSTFSSYCLFAARSVGESPLQTRSRENSRAVFNVRDYGAKCDGKADDSNAIQAAVRAADGQGIVYIPAGTCVFRKPILARKVQIWGVGKNVSILKFTGVKGAAITFDYPIPMYMLSPGMTNLSLIGPGSETTTTGVQLGGGSGAEGARLDVVEIAGFGTGVENAKWSFLTEIRDCYLSDGVDVELTGSPTAGENMRFVHCTFDHTTKPSSVIVDGGDYMQPEFVDCSFDGAILRVRSGMVSVVGGHFEDTVRGGRYLAAIGGGRYEATTSVINVTLNTDGNYAYPASSLFHVLNGGALNVENLEACTVIHNFNVMDVDAGGKGSIVNLMAANCGGWPDAPIAATGKGSENVTQISTLASGANENNVLNGPIQLGKDGPTIESGSGPATGSCVTGSIYLNKHGGPGSTLYVCASGRWVAPK